MNSLMLYITLRQYEYVVAVADLGSLTEAAAHLNVSQPSLSVAITRVEQRLGASVFERARGAQIKITPFGHKFVAQARSLLALATQVERGPKVAAPFVLGCFEDIAPWYLAPALEALRVHLPSVMVQGWEGRFAALATEMAEGRVDVAITYDIGFDGDFERRKITQVSPVAFLATDHPLAKRTSVTLEELVEHPMILFSEHLSEGFVRNLFETLKLDPQVRQRATSLEMMRSLAAHGLGVGMSYSRPPNDISYDGKPLVTVPISTPEAATEIVLVWSRLRGVDAQFERILQILA